MDFREWKWLNESQMTEADGELTITAPDAIRNRDLTKEDTWHKTLTGVS